MGNIIRNALVVANCDAVIAFSGSNGTLSEIAYALQLGKKVLSLGNWELPGIIKSKTPETAVELALRFIENKHNKRLIH